jgi:hypothetical protein
LALFRELDNQLGDLVRCGIAAINYSELIQSGFERRRHFGDLLWTKRMIMFEEEPNGHVLLLIAHAAVVK